MYEYSQGITSSERLTPELHTQLIDDLIGLQAHVFPLDLNHMSGFRYTEGRELLGVSFHEERIIWHGFLYALPNKIKIGDDVGTRHIHSLENRQWVTRLERLTYPSGPINGNLFRPGKLRSVRDTERLESVNLIIDSLVAFRNHPN